MRDITYCTRDCPNLNCSYHKICAPQEAVWYADRYEKGKCPEEAVIMEEKKLEPWEERFIDEHRELTLRVAKLSRMLLKWQKGELDFTPKCSFKLLSRQLGAMCEYLDVLEERAKIEGIEL